MGDGLSRMRRTIKIVMISSSSPSTDVACSYIHGGVSTPAVCLIDDIFTLRHLNKSLVVLLNSCFKLRDVCGVDLSSLSSDRFERLWCAVWRLNRIFV